MHHEARTMTIQLVCPKLALYGERAIMHFWLRHLERLVADQPAWTRREFDIGIERPEENVFVVQAADTALLRKHSFCYKTVRPAGVEARGPGFGLGSLLFVFDMFVPGCQVARGNLYTGSRTQRQLALEFMQIACIVRTAQALEPDPGVDDSQPVSFATSAGRLVLLCLIPGTRINSLAEVLTKLAPRAAVDMFFAPQELVMDTIRAAEHACVEWKNEVPEMVAWLEECRANSNILRQINLLCGFLHRIRQFASAIGDEAARVRLAEQLNRADADIDPRHREWARRMTLVCSALMRQTFNNVGGLGRMRAAEQMFRQMGEPFVVRAEIPWRGSWARPSCLARQPPPGHCTLLDEERMQLQHNWSPKRYERVYASFDKIPRYFGRQPPALQWVLSALRADAARPGRGCGGASFALRMAWK